VARVSAAGHTVFAGHIGTIYQAHNAAYLGRSKPRTLRLLPDGQVISDRTIQKIRARERGWEYGVGLLRRHGAAAPTGNIREWLTHWLSRLTRPLRHPGNHRYAWSLGRRQRLIPVGPYPRKEA
jgi:hypothetical protein